MKPKTLPLPVDLSLIRYRQYLTLGLLLALMVGAFSVLYVLLGGNEVSKIAAPDEAPFSAMDYPESKALWIGTAKKSMDDLNATVKGLQSRLNQLEGAQTAKFAEMAKALAKPKPKEAAQTSQRVRPKKVQRHMPFFMKRELSQPKKLPATPFIPAGSFARAVILGGVDAAANTLSQQDPEPILLRLMEDLHLPNGARAKLKDCVATAAVVGDISSERGHIRLERLSCAEGDLRYELSVEGTVFGQDGKNGVRGQPAWREGKRLQHAAMAGLFSGLLQPLPQLTAKKNRPLSAQKVTQEAVVGSGSQALEKLTEYHIKRAEQYHPIIQIQAGQEVDLVILKGFYWVPKSQEHGE